MGLLDSVNEISSTAGSLLVNTSNVTGNHVVMKFGGIAIGMGQNVTTFNHAEAQKLYGIGSIAAQDLVPGNTQFLIIGELMLVSKKALDQLSMVKDSGMPDYDTSNKTSLVPISANQWIEDGFFDVEVIDRLRKTTLAYYSGCKFERYSLRISKHMIVVSEFAIVAMDRLK